MEIDGFRNYLQERGLEEGEINESISTIHNLETLLKEKTAGRDGRI